MDRRDSLKSIVFGSIGVGVLLEGCVSGVDSKTVARSMKKFNYGRTQSEKDYDRLLFSKKCFSDNEIKLITNICNIILPPNEYGSIVDAEVPELIEFIAKDIPSYESPIKKGLSFLNKVFKEKYSKNFIDCSDIQKKEYFDLIAYPNPEFLNSDQDDMVKWFTIMRNLTMTGYYTSKVGINELGYKGNVPNVWDGVPKDVLDQYNLEYEQEWINKCIDQSKRNDIAVWDENGNLIS
ncbi:MAG: gluconate 2-dehydrogenase subunit 3 family protein [Flavobacteriaceae bacterium]|nr:gluconate 2-dehydrogenase subunit 3 family protein [Flavobacteriaceae bacterium]